MRKIICDRCEEEMGESAVHTLVIQDSNDSYSSTNINKEICTSCARYLIAESKPESIPRAG